MYDAPKYTAPTNRHILHAYWLGTRCYEVIYALQQHLVIARKNNDIEDTVLLLEHTPVITLGRHGCKQHLLVDEATLKKRNIELVHTDRGGDITYHGPGQLVVYPIVNLSPDRCSVRSYINALEQTMIALAMHVGVFAGKIEAYPGVWVHEQGQHPWPEKGVVSHAAKIGAVGVRISRWVTMHGFAFNICPNLQHFQLIIPCGIVQFDVTSLLQLRNTTDVPASYSQLAAEHLSTHLNATLGSFHDLSSCENLKIQMFQQSLPRSVPKPVR